MSFTRPEQRAKFQGCVKDKIYSLFMLIRTRLRIYNKDQQQIYTIYSKNIIFKNQDKESGDTGNKKDGGYVNWYGKRHFPIKLCVTLIPKR